MKKQKHLIVSGCSFTEILSGTFPQDNPPFKTWPSFLIEKLHKHSLSSSALGSQGNGLISRGIIYQVSTQLKNGVNPKDILVGVQWSGSDRMDFLLDDDQIDRLNLDRSLGLWNQNPITNWDGWMENPTGFIPDQPKNWVLTNLGWKLAKDYYAKYHSMMYGAVMTLEHILRTQWFLERNNITYFMTTMNSKVLLPTASSGTDPTIMHLHDQIDFTKFLPIPGMQEWCYGDGENDIGATNWMRHPTLKHQKKFAEDLVFPWLQANNYIGED